MGAYTCHIPTLDTTPEADPGILKGGGGGSDGILAIILRTTLIIYLKDITIT